MVVLLKADRGFIVDGRGRLRDMRTRHPWAVWRRRQESMGVDTAPRARGVAGRPKIPALHGDPTISARPAASQKSQVFVGRVRPRHWPRLSWSKAAFTTSRGSEQWWHGRALMSLRAEPRSTAWVEREAERVCSSVSRSAVSTALGGGGAGDGRHWTSGFVL